MLVVIDHIDLDDGRLEISAVSLNREARLLTSLIGGTDELELCQRLELEKSDKYLNLIGKLSLSETSAVLKSCRVLVSGDTGPAHMAVAVGTPVIGLYGPTNPRRSGPYGCENLILDQSNRCRCKGLKFCTFVNKDEAGECMSRIMLSEVIEKLTQVIGNSAILEQMNNAPLPDGW